MTDGDSANNGADIIEAVLPGVVEPGGLLLNRRPVPVPASGQALVRMEATGVSFAEKAMRRGSYPGQPPFPFVPGYDMVGIVRAVGPDVDRALLGTRVAAITKTGAWASHLLVDAQDLVQVPATLDPCLAETVLVNGVTAWQMLYRKAKVKPGQTILVHGANSGVGVVLCQLAVHAGIRVIGTARLQHHAALRAMGVEPIDRASANLALAVRLLAPDGVDAAFDQLGPESARQSLDLLAPNGSLICYGNVKALSTNVSALRLLLGFLPRIVWWTCFRIRIPSPSIISGKAASSTRRLSGVASMPIFQRYSTCSFTSRSFRPSPSHSRCRTSPPPSPIWNPQAYWARSSWCRHLNTLTSPATVNGEPNEGN